MIGTIKQERKHIVFVGKKNVGKSSLVNAFAGRNVCIVSNHAGTTKGSEKRPMELLPYGKIVLIDTPGIDDTDGRERKGLNKTIKAITNADFAVVMLDARDRLLPEEAELFKYIQKISIPFIIVINKIEYGVNPLLLTEIKWLHAIHFEISCKENVGIDVLKRKMIRMLPSGDAPKLIGDIVNQGDLIVLVVPSDQLAAKRKIILPQIRAIKEALDEDTLVVVAKDKNLRSVLYALKNPPDLIVADNESVSAISAEVPESVKITTYSLLTARFKGDINAFVNGLKAVDTLRDGDKVLIAEACSNHSLADDIGRVTIPGWLRLNTNKDIRFDFNRGGDFPDDISDYKLIVHCEGCMLSRHAMQARIKQASIMEIPIVNYGVFNSFIHGAIPRALEPFNETVNLLDKQ